MADNDRHRVTYEEAARRLGVSVRTVQRRVRVGQLATVSDNGRQYVVLPSSPDDEGSSNRLESSDRSESSRRRENVLAQGQSEGDVDPRIVALEARVAELEADRDMWRTMSAKLSDTVTEQNRMIAAQMMERGRMIAAKTPRPVLEAPVDTHTPPPRIRGLRGLYRAWRGR